MRGAEFAVSASELKDWGDTPLKAMKLTILAVFTALLLHPGLAPCQWSNNATNSECAIVERALGAYRAIKPGITRKELEKNFKYDGGLNFRDHGRYTYRGCDYIKLEVTFEPAPDRGDAFGSPDERSSRPRSCFSTIPQRTSGHPPKITIK
jgi:hypothetical protein